MLVLQRDLSQSIVINLQGLIDIAKENAGPHGEIVVKAIATALAGETVIVITNVAERAGHRVRIGIEAARCIPVHRKEVYDAIQREVPNEPARASASDPDTGKGEGGSARAGSDSV